jgi:hypothetical protein
MAPQLPKISAFTQLLAMPEIQIETAAKNAGITLPPGPQSTLLKIQTALEAGQAPSPEAILPKAPKFEEIFGKLPKLESILPGTKVAERGGATTTAPAGEVASRGEL